jgi:hypothetical protein
MDRGVEPVPSMLRLIRPVDHGPALPAPHELFVHDHLIDVALFLLFMLGTAFFLALPDGFYESIGLPVPALFASWHDKSLLILSWCGL